MPDPMRIRAQLADGKTTVRVLMAHEMESGQRKDPAGQLIPAWHIASVRASLNGKPVFACEWGPAVSRNPLLKFVIKGGQVGDKLSITWQDNKGESRTDEAVVTAAQA
ncbi:thiosulfate oxidation carrier complex protein SoxZ [Ottowia sp.]|uniref:thiosulfate oxidation carrier complex protein SoxZ n=1 Tax=Ottowia sp. TaxID=1898956 RepID=UPI003A854269